MSDADGSLVPVLAHNSRSGRAPALYMRCHRDEASSSGGPVGPLSDRNAKLIPQRPRDLPSTAASQRLTKTEATDPTLGLSPASRRRSIPRKNASAAAGIARAKTCLRASLGPPTQGATVAPPGMVTLTG